MPIQREIDLVINVLGFIAVLWLSIAACIRWIQRGRIEAYSVEALLPKALPSWVRWLLAASCVIFPRPSSSSPQTAFGITPFGWVCLTCLTAWLIVKAV